MFSLSISITTENFRSSFATDVYELFPIAIKLFKVQTFTFIFKRVNPESRLFKLSNCIPIGLSTSNQ